MHLSTVQEIERAIEALTPQQRHELYEWLDRYYAETVDNQLETDLEAGRFDERIEQALSEHKAGKTQPL